MTAYPDQPIWTFILELCHGLERDGVQIVLAVMDGPLAEHQRAALRSLTNVQFHESTFRGEWRDCDAYEIERAGEWLLSLARDFDVDIVHLNELAFGSLPWHAPVLIAAVRRPVMPPRPHLAGSRHAQVAAALAAPTRKLLDDAMQHYICAKHARVIPFGKTSDVHTECTKEPMVVAVTESVRDLTAAAAAVRIAARISWPLFVVGADSSLPAGSSRANAHLLGDLSEVDRYALLCRASVFVQADDAAGYGALDAALFGCTLVLADTPELREKWNGAAVYVARNDEETLRSTLIWLINDAEARNDLSERARHRAQTYTAEKMAAAYLSAYIDLALNGPVVLDPISASPLSTDRPELSHS